MNQNSGDPIKPTASVAKTTNDDDPPFEVDAPVATSTVTQTKTESTPISSDSRAQDILAMIRNRPKS